jgi:hypothetical protein
MRASLQTLIEIEIMKRMKNELQTELLRNAQGEICRPECN